MRFKNLASGLVAALVATVLVPMAGSDVVSAQTGSYEKRESDGYIYIYNDTPELYDNIGEFNWFEPPADVTQAMHR